VLSNCFEGVKFLLEKGADPHLEDKYGKDACDYAKMSSKWDQLKEIFPEC